MIVFVNRKMEFALGLASRNVVFPLIVEFIWPASFRPKSIAAFAARELIPLRTKLRLARGCFEGCNFDDPDEARRIYVFDDEANQDKPQRACHSY